MRRTCIELEPDGKCRLERRFGGTAAATPIVWEDRIFLSGVDEANDTLQAMCFDRVRGRLLWNHHVAKGIRRDSRSNYASASPVTDGQLAIFFYGNGDLVCFDFAGGRRCGT